MEFRSRLSLRPEVDDAVFDLCVDLKSFRPDLAVLFATHHYGPDFLDLIKGIYDRANARVLIGCTAESVVGPTSEIESQPAVALWTAKLPNVRVFPFVLDQEDLLSLTDRDAWTDRLGATPEQSPSFILLPDPFSINMENCLLQTDKFFPGATVVGGLASGAAEAGQNRLFLNDQALRQGLVGISLVGQVRITSLVSQGCRPIGEPFVVTQARDNLIEELGGRPAIDVLRDVYHHASSGDQELMRRGLHVGRLVDVAQGNPDPRNFLIRQMMGVYEDRALAVGDFFRPGQTVRFHLRDANSADEEMRMLLEGERSRHPQPPAGALLFTCNGRGRRFFDRPNHDIGLVNELVQGCETAGFFAQGEIGPVGGRTFIHGYTSSLILFREP